jgi:hypothetical protein
MLRDDWKKLTYFSEREKWGDPTKMDLNFLLRLDRFRELAGIPFTVYCGYETSGHTDKSQHYLSPCRAVDGNFKDRKLSPLDCYILADRIGFNGFGLYSNNGNWFIHCDGRYIRQGDYKRRWIRDDSGKYWALNAKNFITYIDPIQKLYV